MKTIYGILNKLLIVILFDLAACSIKPKDVVYNNIPDTCKLFFLNEFDNDRVIVNKGNQLLLDTVFSTSPTTGIGFIKEVYTRNIKIRFNTDTAFSLDLRRKFNNVLFKKQGRKYHIIYANDTLIVTM